MPVSIVSALLLELEVDQLAQVTITRNEIMIILLFKSNANLSNLDT